MAFDLSSGFGGLAGQGTAILQGFVYIALLVPAMIGFAFLILWAVKNRRYVYNVFIYRDLGNGKALFNQTKAGYFKRNKILFGLIDRTGERQLETKGNRLIAPRVIESPSDVDMIDINFKKGFMVMQKEDDDRILIPISTINIKNKDLIMNIAPGDYRDAGVRIMQTNEREVMSGMDRYMPLIAIGIVAIIALVIFVFIIQFGTYALDTSWTHTIEAQQILQKAKDAVVTLPSQAP